MRRWVRGEGRGQSAMRGMGLRELVCAGHWLRTQHPLLSVGVVSFIKRYACFERESLL